MMERILNPIKRRIQLMIGRCILTAVDNSKKTMMLECEVLKNEKLTQVERLEEFGFASYPPADRTTEGLLLFVNGNRDFGFCIKAHNREAREDIKSDLEEGASIQYGKDSAGSYTNKIIIKPTSNTIEIENQTGHKITVDNTGIKLSTGDAALWKPCIIPNCIFSGAPHGGAAGGIIKLKGG